MKVGMIVKKFSDNIFSLLDFYLLPTCEDFKFCRNKKEKIIL